MLEVFEKMEMDLRMYLKRHGRLEGAALRTLPLKHDAFGCGGAPPGSASRGWSSATRGASCIAT